MFKNAVIGDRVFDYTLQEWGYIKHVECTNRCPILVKYEDETKTYTVDGKEYYTDKAPTLFWDEVKPIIPPKKPLPKLKVDTKVIVWSYENIIYRRYFSHFDENGAINCFNNGATSWSEEYTSRWDNWELADKQKELL